MVVNETETLAGRDPCSWVEWCSYLKVVEKAQANSQELRTLTVTTEQENKLKHVHSRNMVVHPTERKLF